MESVFPFSAPPIIIYTELLLQKSLTNNGDEYVNNFKQVDDLKFCSKIPKINTLKHEFFPSAFAIKLMRGTPCSYEFFFDDPFLK